MAKDEGKPFTPRTMGERIAHARRQLGVREGRDIQPPELASRIGVTGASVYNWENGVVPSEANLEKLARVLGVTPAWLRYGIEGGTMTFGTLDVPLSTAIELTPGPLERRRKRAEEEAAKKAAAKKKRRPNSD